MTSFNSTQAVSDWNLKCANKPSALYTPEYWQSLKNQAERLVEEVNELVSAVAARDRIETVDAQADIQVVLDGLIFLSQHDHVGAMQAVCANNDLKYTTSRAEAEGWASPIEKLKRTTVNVQRAEFEGKTYYSVHNDSDNKVMKPVNLPKVELSQFVAGADEHEIFVISKPVCPICSGLILNLTKTLGLKNLTVLKPYESEADNEFCIENELTIGDIAFYNGCEIKKTNYGTEQFDIRRVERFLKTVGAI